MLILNIETSTKNCSVTLAKNGITLVCKEVAEEGFSHAENLHVFIEQVIKESAITFKDINAIAVSKGPGSYTGLRIGVSAAKGLCYALRIPLISVDTLTVLASQLKIDKGYIVPMIDARRMEVYSAIFDINHNLIRGVEAEILTSESFTSPKEIVHFIGDSTEKAKTILQQSNFVFHEEIVYPSSKEMSLLSYDKFINNEFEDVAYFEPYYLKDFLIQTKPN